MKPHAKRQSDSQPGGKAAQGVRQTLINLICPHDTYTAAFAGYDAIGRFKRPAAVNTFLDVDQKTIRRLKNAIEKAWPVDPAAKSSGGRSRDDGFGGVAGVAAGNGDSGSPLFEYRLADALTYLRHRFELDQLAPPKPKAFAATFRDYCRQNKRIDFVYLDPPYPLSTRVKKRIYERELTDEEHAELLAIARSLPCFVMVSCYPCRLYDEALADWERFEYDGQTRGGRRREVVWINYPKPDRLHDSRFVGIDRRERERIRKRARNLKAGIARETPLFQQAMLDEVRAVLDEFDSLDC